MFGLNRVVIARHERGLYLKDRNIVSVLEPGVYWANRFARTHIAVYDLSDPEFMHAHVDTLLKEQPALVEKYFQVIELGDYEVGVVYKNGKLDSVLPPATRQLYWRGPIDVKVEVHDIAQDFALAPKVARLIAHARAKSLPLINYVYLTEVADNHIGLLIVDGALVETLKPGLYVFWKFNRTVKVEHLDLRVQAMEVSGQEILTKDKVSLRINLSASYQITDPVKARENLTDFTDHLYRELQFALRQAIGTRALDTLLGNKGELDHAIHDAVRATVGEHGIDVRSVGVKDVILPGEMKNILNQVVEAEKTAQANVIKRREETAATRSLLNTARLMDDNPTLLRLKELEVLEKVTEKVDKLTVFGGLDGVLKDTVRINVRSD